jgi:hypothetical protein
MPAVQFCTVAQVKEWADYKLATSDTMISTLIDRVTAQIQSWTSRDFSQQSYIEVYNGSGTSQLPVKQGPVTAVASLTIYGQTIPASATPTAWGYTFKDRIIYLRGSAPLAPFDAGGWSGGAGMIFPLGNQNVEITYTAGFATIPDAITQACIEWVAFKLKERERIGYKSQNIGQQNIGYITDAMPDGVRQALMQYKRVTPV